jgi:hypothetical protein
MANHAKFVICDYSIESAQDGHITNGAIPFSVGLHTPPVSLLPPLGALDPATDLPSRIDVFLRGLGYVSMVLLFGPVLFAVLIWRPTYPSAGDSPRDWDIWMHRWFRLLVFWGGIAGALSLVGLAIWQSLQLREFSGAALSNAGLARGILSQLTWVSWTRLIALVALVGLTNILPSAG